MKIIDETTAPLVRPSMFLHGVTGEGKSTWSTAGGRPLVILMEPKATSVVKQINPNAVGLVPESLDDLDSLMVLLGQPEKLQARKIDRIVLDSYTGLTEILPEWIRKRAQAPNVLRKAMEIQEYGHLGDYALAIVKAIQLTGYPSVIIGRSISKKVGLGERIMPDSVGKSVNSLPGKLLPTAEARFDAELGYVIDTTPAEHSQRCGLPWVPQVYQGTCLDYLRIIEAGPQGGDKQPTTSHTTKAPATAPRASASPSATVETGATAPGAPMGAAQPVAQGAQAPVNPPTTQEPQVLEGKFTPLSGSDDPAWVEALVSYAAIIQHLSELDRTVAVGEWERKYAENAEEAKRALAEYLMVHGQVRDSGIDPEKDPEGYRKAFGEFCAKLQAEKIAEAKQTEHSAEVNAFVEGVSPEVAKAEDITALMDLAREHSVKTDALWAYAIHRKAAKPMKDGGKNWNSLGAQFVKQVTQQLTDAGKRRTFIPWIHQTYSTK